MSGTVTIRVPAELHYSLHEAAEMLRALKRLGADCGPIIDDLEEMYELAKGDRIVDRRAVSRDHAPVTVTELHARNIRVDNRFDDDTDSRAVRPDSTRRGLLAARANEHTENQP